LYLFVLGDVLAPTASPASVQEPNIASSAAASPLISTTPSVVPPSPNLSTDESHMLGTSAGGPTSINITTPIVGVSGRRVISVDSTKNP